MKEYDLSPYICPHCSYEMDEEEAESTCDEGCPSCRCIIEWEDDHES